MWHVVTAYLVGTAAGLGIFRHWIKTNLVMNALDNLIDQDYIRSYVDEEGITQLYKWYELDDVIERLYQIKADEDLIQEAINDQNKLWENDDDSA